MKRHPQTLAAFIALGGILHASTGDDFFEKKVRPLLTERCYECHSAEKKIKGGLRLDSRDGWKTGGDSGPAVHPGEPEKSLIVEAVRYSNRDMQMPPKQRLNPEEVAIVEEWVRIGAPDPRTETAVGKKQTGLTVEEGRQFWCYAPLKKPTPPPVKNTEWVRSGIDQFLLAAMEKAGITPAPDAEPHDLVRRIYYALIGLPPSPEQTDAFLKEAQLNRDAAVRRVIESLLNSPHFGEAWGRHWLDIVRFAESSGGGRTLLFKDAWLYRDYVMESLNSDVPLNRFITEQIAGDLLPSANTVEKRRFITATGFLALGPTNYEEQEKQQLRFDIIDEQLETIGRAFLGQTIGCARCHDHKFDPIPQRDYYALAGIFASTRTLQNFTDNVARWISLPLPEEESRETILAAHEQKISSLKVEREDAQKALSALHAPVSTPTKLPGAAIPASSLQGIVLDDSDAKIVGEWKHSSFVKTFIGEGYISDENSGKGEKTVTFSPAIREPGRYELRLAYAAHTNRAKNVKVSVLHADGEETIQVDQTRPPPIDGRFISLGTYRFEKDGAGFVLISNQDTHGYVTVDALQLLPESTIQKGAESPKLTTDPLDVSPAALAKRKVQDLESQIKSLTKTGPFRKMAMAVREEDSIEDTSIRVRGIERQKGPEVPRGFLQVTLTHPSQALSKETSGRKELAEWIVSDTNPLTARVLVNRVWSWLFGSGIVASVDNFGTTGDLPSNPELLDHLANYLIANHWSVKQLIREIMLTRAWQVAVTPSIPSDPENRLFSHANRRRMTAEQIRDTILSVAGSLDTSIGGPNINGAGEIDANNSSAQNIEYTYVYQDVRRSFYTPAFRNKRLELFESFDFANINQPIGQRTSSTVAPQALYLLNGTFVHEQSAKAAAHTLSLPAASDEERLILAYKRSLGRPPSAKEKALSLRFLKETTDPFESWSQLHQMLFACLDFRFLN